MDERLCSYFNHNQITLKYLNSAYLEIEWLEKIKRILKGAKLGIVIAI
jgi:hypothetical protein